MLIKTLSLKEGLSHGNLRNPKFKAGLSYAYIERFNNFSVDLLKENEQDNPEKIQSAHVPINKSPHMAERVVFRRVSSLKMAKKST